MANISYLNKDIIENYINLTKNKLDDFDIFIESGTFMGETTFEMSKIFQQVYTFEIKEELYNYCLEKYKKENINFFNTDSVSGFKKIIDFINTNNCIFYLDGHFSGELGVPNYNNEQKEFLTENSLKNIIKDNRGRKKNRVVVQTGKYKKDVPLIEELIYVDENFRGNAIIIIDDIHLLGTLQTHGDWRPIKNIKCLKNCIKKKTIIDSIIKDNRLIMNISD